MCSAAMARSAPGATRRIRDRDEVHPDDLRLAQVDISPPDIGGHPDERPGGGVGLGPMPDEADAAAEVVVLDDAGRLDERIFGIDVDELGRGLEPDQPVLVEADLRAVEAGGTAGVAHRDHGGVPVTDVLESRHPQEVGLPLRALLGVEQRRALFLGPLLEPIAGLVVPLLPVRDGHGREPGEAGDAAAAVAALVRRVEGCEVERRASHCGGCRDMRVAPVAPIPLGDERVVGAAGVGEPTQLGVERLVSAVVLDDRTAERAERLPRLLQTQVQIEPELDEHVTLAIVGDAAQVRLFVAVLVGEVDLSGAGPLVEGRDLHHEITLRECRDVHEPDREHLAWFDPLETAEVTEVLPDDPSVLQIH